MISHSSHLVCCGMHIDRLGPEAFRSILEQFVGEVSAGEGCRNHGSALVSRLKDAAKEKAKVQNPRGQGLRSNTLDPVVQPPKNNS